MNPGEPAGITVRCADTCHTVNITKEISINLFILHLFYFFTILPCTAKESMNSL